MDRLDTVRFESLTETLIVRRDALATAIRTAMDAGHQRAPGYVRLAAEQCADAELEWAREGERLRLQQRQRLIHITYYRVAGQHIDACDVYFGVDTRKIEVRLAATEGQRPPAVLDDVY